MRQIVSRAIGVRYPAPSNARLPAALDVDFTAAGDDEDRTRDEAGVDVHARAASRTGSSRFGENALAPPLPYPELVPPTTHLRRIFRAVIPGCE